MSDKSFKISNELTSLILELIERQELEANLKNMKSIKEEVSSLRGSLPVSLGGEAEAKITEYIKEELDLLDVIVDDLDYLKELKIELTLLKYLRKVS